MTEMPAGEGAPTSAASAPGVAAGTAARWERRLSRPSAYALYLHIPFCASKCRYCDFASWARRRDDALLPAYLRGLQGELQEAAGAGLLDGLETAYIGGGTPTLLGDALCGLVAQVAALGPCELSSEANPDSLTPELARALAASGLTRLSIGVQSTDDGELHALGRIHDGHRALRAIGWSADAGLSTSCDLMCAIPRQTDASWRRSLEDVVAAGACHVSAYPLQIEEGTDFGFRFLDAEPAWNDPDIQARRMTIARDVLSAHGFSRYEVASHALPHERCGHNIAYWTGQPYLGLGTGAASMLAPEGYARLRAIAPRLPELPEDARRARLTVESGPEAIAAGARIAGLSFSIEFLTEGQAAAEDLMLGARLADGVSAGCLAHARALFGARLDAAMADVRASGLAAISPRTGALVPTENGWLLGNELYGRLWDLAEGTIGSVRVEAAAAPSRGPASISHESEETSHGLDE